MSEEKECCNACGGTNGHWEGCKGEAVLEEQIKSLESRLKEAEKELESYRQSSVLPECPMCGKMVAVICPDDLEKLKNAEKRLSQALRVGYKCEHIAKNEISGDCVHCNLVVAENAVKKLQKDAKDHIGEINEMVCNQKHLKERLSQAEAENKETWNQAIETSLRILDEGEYSDGVLSAIDKIRGLRK